MIKRNSSTVVPNDTLRQSSLTAKKGIDSSKNIVVNDVAYDMCNLNVDEDGSLTLRKPIIFSKLFDTKVGDTSLKCVKVIPLYTGEHTFIVYSTANAQYIAIIDSDGDAKEIDFKCEHYITYAVNDVTFESIGNNYYKTSGIINFENVSPIQTSSTTVLGACTIDVTCDVLKYNLYDPKLLEESYAKKAPRYVQIYKDTNNSGKFIVCIKTSEVNNLDKGADIPFNPNLTLDNPFAIRDEYNSSYADITGIQMYAPTKMDFNGAPTHTVQPTTSETIEDGVPPNDTYATPLPWKSIVGIPLTFDYSTDGINFNFEKIIDGVPYYFLKYKSLDSLNILNEVTIGFKVSKATCKMAYTYRHFSDSNEGVSYKIVDIDFKDELNVHGGDLRTEFAYGTPSNTISSGVFRLYGRMFKDTDWDTSNDPDGLFYPSFGGIIDTYSSTMHADYFRTVHSTDPNFYIDCGKRAAATLIQRILDVSKTSTPNYSVYEAEVEPSKGDRYQESRGVVSVPIIDKYNGNSSTFGAILLYNPELEYSMWAEYSNSDGSIIAIDLGTFHHTCNHSDFSFTASFYGESNSGLLKYYPAIFSYTKPSADRHSLSIKPTVSKPDSVSGTWLYKNTESSIFPIAYGEDYTKEYTIPDTDKKLILSKRYYLDVTKDGVGVIDVSAKIKLNENFTDKTVTYNSGYTLYSTGETEHYKGGVLSTNPENAFTSNRVRPITKCTYDASYLYRDGIALTIKINFTNNIIQGARVIDLTESVKYNGFRIVNTAAFSNNELNETNRTYILKAFIKAPPTGQLDYYGVWEYSNDGVEWKSVYTTAVGANAKKIKLLKYTLQETLESSTSVSELYNEVYAHNMSSVKSPEDAIVGTADSNITYPVNRPDCLLLTNGSNELYGTATDLMKLNPSFRFTLCTIENLYVVKTYTTLNGYTTVTHATSNTKPESVNHSMQVGEVYTEDDGTIRKETTYHGICAKNTIAQQTYNVNVGTVWEFAYSKLNNAVHGHKLYYGNRIYSYNDPKFLNNVVVSDANSFITPLLDMADLNTLGLTYVTCILPWRNYIIAATENSIHLLSKTDVGFLVKTVTNSIGIPSSDGGTCKSLYNGVIFKSGSKVYTLYPNLSSGDDSILNLNEISKPIDHALQLIGTTNDNCFSISTDRDYYTFIPHTDTSPVRTDVLKYNFNAKIWTRYEYPNVIFTDYIMNGVDDIRLIGTYNNIVSEFYFEKTLEDVPNVASKYSFESFDNVPYGDYLTEASLSSHEPSPINFKLDTGQRTDNMSVVKKFVESKIVLATVGSKPAANLNVEVYVDGNPYPIALKGDGIVLKTTSNDILTFGDAMPSDDADLFNTVGHAFVRYAGKGKTIRHIITGESLYNFKLYEIFYRYRIGIDKQ